LDFSITISIGSCKIYLEYLKKIEEIIEKECILGLCSIERGGALSRLHLQMVCWILASSATMVNKCIKSYIEWNKAKIAPIRHHILTKMLCNTGLHTFIGISRYCMKDRCKDHFHCVHWNITPKQIAKGIEKYVKHGTLFAKNRIILTHKNFIGKATTFYRSKMKKQLGSTLPNYLLTMLQLG